MMFRRNITDHSISKPPERATASGKPHPSLLIGPVEKFLEYLDKMVAQISETWGAGGGISTPA
jgi:hypothetical protein